MTTMLPTTDPDEHGTTLAPVVPPPYDPRDQDDRHDDDRDGPAAARRSTSSSASSLVAVLAGGAYVMQNYLFEQPPDEVRVPNLIGLSENQARNAVVDAGLRVGDVSYEPSEDASRIG